MQENWVVAAKRADFQAIGEKFHIDPVIARLIRNRDVTGDEAIRQYLEGRLEDLADPLCMKGMQEAVALLQAWIAENRKIRVIGDYDIDGIMSSYILVTALTSIVQSWTKFEVIWVLTAGGPGYTTSILPTYIYSKSFVMYDMGQGSAVSVLAMLCMLIFVVAYLKIYNRSAEGVN